MRSLVLVAAIATAADAAPCPLAETLAPLAREAWGGSPVAPSCIEIRAPRPLVLVVDAADLEGRRPASPSSAMTGYAAIVDAGTVQWHVTFHHMTPGTWHTWTVHDLDGDGIDELVDEEDHTGHMSFGSRRLIVHPIVDGVPGDGAALQLDQYGLVKGALQNGCHATFRIVRDRRRSVIEVAGTLDSDPALRPPPDECPRAGKHRYAWTGGTLVETP